MNLQSAMPETLVLGYWRGKVPSEEPRDYTDEERMDLLGLEGDERNPIAVSPLEWVPMRRLIQIVEEDDIDPITYIMPDGQYIFAQREPRKRAFAMVGLLAIALHIAPIKVLQVLEYYAHSRFAEQDNEPFEEEKDVE